MMPPQRPACAFSRIIDSSSSCPHAAGAYRRPVTSIVGAIERRLVGDGLCRLETSVP